MLQAFDPNEWCLKNGLLGGGLNPRPLSHESSALTTRPRLLAFHQLKSLKNVFFIFLLFKTQCIVRTLNRINRSNFTMVIDSLDFVSYKLDTEMLQLYKFNITWNLAIVCGVVTVLTKSSERSIKVDVQFGSKCAETVTTFPAEINRNWYWSQI